MSRRQNSSYIATNAVATLLPSPLHTAPSRPACCRAGGTITDALQGLSIAPAPSAAEHRHAVQFYEDDAFLCDTVAEFVSGALSAHEPALVIATEPHREGLAAVLAARGVDVPRVRVSGQLTLLDARELLDRFMVAGMPDAALFREVVGEALDRAARIRAGAVVRAFGEMVDLLWREGRAEAAIRLMRSATSSAPRMPTPSCGSGAPSCRARNPTTRPSASARKVTVVPEPGLPTAYVAPDSCTMGAGSPRGA